MSVRANILSLKLGDVDCQSVLVSHQWVLTVMNKHGQVLVTMLWRILGNEQDVLDAYQDTFLRLAHCNGGQQPRNVRSFVFSTASNVAISMLRRRKVHMKACQAVASRCTEQYQPAGGELDSRVLQEMLRSCILRLPQRLRDVVLLKDLGELSYGQVAEILGMSAATARVYRFRAVQLLAAWMAREGGG